MKKIPTLFNRVFEGHRIIGIEDKPIEGMEWVFNGEGEATVKWDGACCAIINGELYKRYDAKHGKPIPEGAIKCQEEADPITGHLPCWVKCDEADPSDKWFIRAEKACGYTKTQLIPYRTYEAVGKHFNGNPYNMEDDTLIPHGESKITVDRTFEGIREYLRTNDIEGIVFWKDGEPKCKIKRTDFGFEWGNGKRRR